MKFVLEIDSWERLAQKSLSAAPSLIVEISAPNAVGSPIQRRIRAISFIETTQILYSPELQGISWSKK
jgi:hypothetical protein